MMATYSVLLVVAYLEIHLEMEIETQLGLLEETILDLQLSPLITLYCWMGKRSGGMLEQKHQNTCRTLSKAFISRTCSHHKFCLNLHHRQLNVLE